MKDLDPKARADKALFPKLFAGEYGAEISTLLTSNAQIIHSSFYDGDLEFLHLPGVGARTAAAHSAAADHGRVIALAARVETSRTGRSSARAARTPSLLTTAR